MIEAVCTLLVGARVVNVLPHHVDRFWRHCDKKSESECWPWLGALKRDGYGAVTISGEHTRSHRLSWAINKGEIPLGLWVLHKCDNPKCVNPDHLFLGDTVANTADKVSKGRQAKGSWVTANSAKARREKPFCKNGHAFSPENTRITNGHRHCRACARAFAKKYSSPDYISTKERKAT